MLLVPFLFYRNYDMTHKDDLKEHLLVDLHELLVPLVNVGRLLARIRVVVGSGSGVGDVVSTPLEDLVEDGFIHLKSVMLVSRAVRECVVGFDAIGLRLGWGWAPRQFLHLYHQACS
jgi:hypothetical protein